MRGSISIHFQKKFDLDSLHARENETLIPTHKFYKKKKRREGIGGQKSERERDIETQQKRQREGAETNRQTNDRET